MRYKNILSGIFLERPNRFIARVDIAGEIHVCHVKNTGRLGELLVPGARVFLQPADNPERKTRYDLMVVEKEGILFNIDSSAPNAVFAEYLQERQPLGPLRSLKREAVYGHSRLDFTFETGEKRYYAEVKGVTLLENGVALFPDAPTPRGVRHLDTLVDCLQAGYGALAVFVIQMTPAQAFSPHDVRHPAFGEALRRASEQGVEIWALDCDVAPDQLTIRDRIPIRL